MKLYFPWNNKGVTVRFPRFRFRRDNEGVLKPGDIVRYEPSSMTEFSVGRKGRLAKQRTLQVCKPQVDCEDEFVSCEPLAKDWEWARTMGLDWQVSAGEREADDYRIDFRRTNLRKV